MGLDPDQIATRLPLWKALSELFLDTELDGGHFKLIASAVTDSGLSVSEVEEVLWNDVFPALGANLQVPAGAWADFDAEWLRERIVNVSRGLEPGLRTDALIPPTGVRAIVEEAWLGVKSQLPE